MADLTGGSLLDRIDLLARTEKGLTYIGPSGEVVHTPRHALLSAAVSRTSQAIYGDQHAVDAGRATLRVRDVTPVRDTTLIYPSARVTRVGGAPQTYTDQASLDEYGNRILDESGLLYDSDLDSFAAAAYQVARYKDEHTRFEQVRIDPTMQHGIWWPEILGRQFGERVTVDRTPQGVGPNIDQDCYLEGRQITFTPGECDVILRLAPADTTKFALWDSDVWGDGQWCF